MAIERFLEDVAIIRKQSDDPIKDGYTTEEFKADFDKAALLIQSYINEVLCPFLDGLNASAIVVGANKPNSFPALWIDTSSSNNDSGSVKTVSIKYVDLNGDVYTLNPQTVASAITGLTGICEPKAMRFKNVTAPVSAFSLDSTEPEFPYRAGIALTGVTEDMDPEVVFSTADAISGEFSPVARTYAGGVYVYARTAPSAAVSIPRITVWRDE